MKIKNFIIKNKYNIIFIFLILSISLGMMIFARSDSDYFWHFTAGKYMINNHTILTHDVFSWYLKGTYWMSHEWLFEIIIYSLFLLFGKYSLLIYDFICLFILLLIIYFGNRKGFMKNKAFSLLWLSLVLLLDGFITGRPHMISFILLAITIYLYKDLYDNEKSNKIFIMPIITIIWANVHGGSSNLTYIFCFIFLLCSLINIKIGKIESRRRSKNTIIKYLIVMILCMLCINIGPHSYSMFLYPYQNLNDTLMISNITEWQPTVISEGSHLPFFIVSFIVLLIFLLSKKKIRLLDFILYCLMLFLGLKSLRFWPYIYIVMSFFVFDYVFYRKDDKGTELIYLLVSFVCLFIFIYSFNIIVKETNKFYLNSKSIDIIKKEKPKRLYNMYDYGGELIYNNVDVFIDGRADLYSKYNFEDAVDISHLDGNYKKIINKYDFDYFFVSKSYRINRYLKNSNKYKSIYCDKKSCIYKKID